MILSAACDRCNALHSEPHHWHSGSQPLGLGILGQSRSYNPSRRMWFVNAKKQNDQMERSPLKSNANMALLVF